MASHLSEKTEEVTIVAESNWKFLAKIYNALASSDCERSNLALSSFSISSVLALAMAGAKGATHEQMQEALCLPKEKQIKDGYKQIFTILKANDENFTMNVANQVFVNKKYQLLESYIEHAAKYFLVKPQSLDFGKSEEACDIINSWGEKETHNKIKNVASPVDINNDTRAVLVNAIYLKMKWENAFPKELTKQDTFYLTPSSTLKASLMNGTGNFRVCSFDELACDVLEMPCKGNQFSMLFFLPKTHADFRQMESKLSQARLEKLSQTPKTTYEVTIPRFKLEATHDLNGHLMSLGMTDMFDDKKADFLGMAKLDKGEVLYISKVTQKVVIEVAEDGCEAAALTASYAVVLLSSAGRTITNPKFTCNRPFIFVIKNNVSGIVLFSGRIMNPTV